MAKLVDIIYVREYEMARFISKTLYEEKGLDVGISNVTIDTGTHGEHQSWRLDVMERPEVKECINCREVSKIFEREMCIQCFTDEVLLKDVSIETE